MVLRPLKQNSDGDILPLRVRNMKLSYLEEVWEGCRDAYKPEKVEITHLIQKNKIYCAKCFKVENIKRDIINCFVYKVKLVSSK